VSFLVAMVIAWIHFNLFAETNSQRAFFLTIALPVTLFNIFLWNASRRTATQRYSRMLLDTPHHTRSSPPGDWGVLEGHIEPPPPRKRRSQDPLRKAPFEDQDNLVLHINAPALERTLTLPLKRATSASTLEWLRHKHGFHCETYPRFPVGHQLLIAGRLNDEGTGFITNANDALIVFGDTKAPAQALRQLLNTDRHVVTAQTACMTLTLFVLLLGLLVV